MSNTGQTLLVTGANGSLGRRVVELLLERGAGNVVALTRDPAKLKAFAERGVDVRKGDFDEPGPLTEAFAGVDRALLISTDKLDAPGARLKQHRAGVAAAAAAGVKHIVYTSGPSPHPDPAFVIADDHFWTEQAVIAAAPAGGWTMLRDNIYHEMVLMGLASAMAGGKLFHATRGGRRGYVAREDVAAVAVAALASDYTGTRILDVTGPEALGQDDIAAIASAVTGRTIEAVDVGFDGLKQGMMQAGLPEPVADLFVGFDREVSQGYYDIATSAVKDLTGREPTSFRAFLEANRTALAGNAG